MRFIILYLVALVAAVTFGVRGGDTARRPWHIGYATSYATWEHLLGCRSDGNCYTQCPNFPVLDNYALTVNANNRLDLPCGTRLEFWLWDTRRKFMIKKIATVTDHDPSFLKYDFEFSYRLSRIFGAPDQQGKPLTWSAYISWRTA